MARILVVDDDSDILELVRMHLHREGHQVLTATNGLAALDAIYDRDPPDLAVLDVTMPKMDGFTLAAALRRQPGCANLPIIFLTARTADSDVRTGLDLGAHYLTKPLMAGALLHFVEMALKERPVNAGW
jgi:two-component system, OmpR family, response regulator MtrA